MTVRSNRHLRLSTLETKPTSSSGNVVSGPSPQSKVGPRYLNFDLRRIDVTYSDIAGLLMREPERMLQQAGSPDR